MKQTKKLLHMPPARPGVALALTADQFTTLLFAFVNYEEELKGEIRVPTRHHGAAEAASALADLQDLMKIPVIAAGIAKMRG